MDVITEQFDNISLNQLHAKLSTKYAQLAKAEKQELVETIKNKDYIEASGPDVNKDEKDFARVLAKFKNKDAEIRTHEQAHASIGHTTSPISYNYQQGPDGKMYAVGGSVRMDTSIPDDPKAAAFKLDILQKAALGPASTSEADNTIASQSNLNKILLQLKGEDNAG